MEKETSQNWQQHLAKLDEGIKLGRHQEVIDQLETLCRKKELPREFASQLANFAFRISQPLLALKVLHPYINNELLNQKPPTTSEKIAYASGLFSLGAIREANQILNSIKSNEDPEVLFHQGISGFYDWNYSNSVNRLQAYIALPHISDYRRLVGKVNLVAAYIYLFKWDTAEPLITELIASCEKENHILLLGNCMELKAQFYFFQKCYAEALAAAVQALDILKNQNGLYLLYAKKWQVLAKYFLNPNVNSLHELENIATQAKELRHWNTLRECDLFFAMAKQDTELAKKVIMGTPAESYHRRVHILMEQNIKTTGKYIWNLNENASETKTSSADFPVFDPFDKLYQRPQLLAVYDALTRDFYKPVNIGELFQVLFPEEKFNYLTSPTRVLKALRRLNEWFESNVPLLKIHFQKSEFSISALKPINLIVNRGQALSSRKGHLESLREIFPYRNFSVSQAAESLSISKATALRLIKSSLTDRTLLQTGSGRATQYRFQTSTKK